VTGKPAPHRDPTFTLAGAPQCAITYGPRQDGKMYWTAHVTVAGELLTFAHDTAGDFYRFDIWVTPGDRISFVAPQPLWKIDNVGGFLYGRGTYPCTIVPAK
jgi:hypothetical protein